MTVPYGMFRRKILPIITGIPFRHTDAAIENHIIEIAILVIKNRDRPIILQMSRDQCPVSIFDRIPVLAQAGEE